MKKTRFTSGKTLNLLSTIIRLLSRNAFNLLCPIATNTGCWKSFDKAYLRRGITAQSYWCTHMKSMFGVINWKKFASGAFAMCFRQPRALIIIDWYFPRKSNRKYIRQDYYRQSIIIIIIIIVYILNLIVYAVVIYHARWHAFRQRIRLYFYS